MRKNIIVNTLWGNLNLAVRYGSSFVATFLLASVYTPEQFGLYQLVLTTITMVGVFNFFHPAHLSNHLIKNPEDESRICGLWALQSLVIWIGVTIFLAVAYLRDRQDEFLYLMLLSSGRLFFKVTECVGMAASVRLRNDLAQLSEMFGVGVFNLVRVILALLKAPVTILTLATPSQGLFLSAYHLIIRRKLGIVFSTSGLSLGFAKDIFRSGMLMTIVGFLAGFQARIFSVLLSFRMPPADYGNFQLVIKLIEPLTAVAVIIFGVNYTVLAHTLNRDVRTFYKRFLKVGVVCLGVAALFCITVVVVPPDFFVAIFGSKYRDAAELVWMGSWMVLTGTFLMVVQQYDTLRSRYGRLIVVNLAIVLLYGIAVLYYTDGISIREAMVLSAVIPFVVAVLALCGVLIDMKRDRNET
nr:hypothetical protein BdHM001_14120 [Bdellovibrio sp. HM001]